MRFIWSHKMKVFIIYTSFFKQDGKELNIGGIETYIQNLIPVFNSLGYETIIIQKANFDFEKEYEKTTVIGVRCKNKKYQNDLYKKCRSLIDIENDILIFANDLLNVKNDVKKSISIQHGIYWDKPTFSRNKLYNISIINFLKKAKESYEIIKRTTLTKYNVCVDFNYINWYRSVYAYKEPNKKITPILNFTNIPTCNDNKQLEDEVIKIIFARRFFDYRGTRIFAEAIDKILSTYKNIEVTVAGEGPDESYLHQKLDKHSNVCFLKYLSSESLQIHKDKHIAVIPTLGSEGTSLSLLEAMASNCAVVCTNIGGMTNIVLDHYNGLMINPNPQDLFDSLCELIENKTLRINIAKNAYESACETFSLSRWQSQWKKLIEEVSNGT